MMEASNNEENECVICCEKIMDSKEFYNLFIEKFDYRKSILKLSKKMNHCGHKFHSGCIHKWYYDQFEKNVLPLCPLCRTELFSPPVKDDFPVRWLKDDKKLYGLDESGERKPSGFYVVGPYPCEGDVDYGHEQVRFHSKKNNMVYDGCKLSDEFDDNFINEHSDMILAVYFRTTRSPSFSRKLLAIGDNILIIKTGEIVNRLNLR